MKTETGPYSYLPQMEYYLEAHLWNAVFSLVQDYMAYRVELSERLFSPRPMEAAFDVEEVVLFVSETWRMLMRRPRYFHVWSRCFHLSDGLSLRCLRIHRRL